MSSRPPVSVFSLHFPPELTGNAPYAGALVSGLRKLGHDVEGHVGHPHYPEWEIRPGYGQWHNLDVHEGAPVHRRLHYVPNPPRGARRFLSEASFGLRVLMARWAPAGIAVTLSPSMVASALVVLRARLSRRPCIVWVQDLYTLGLRETGQGRGPAASIVGWIERTALRGSDRVVVIHQRFADFVVRDLGVDAARVEVIRNWTHLPPASVISKDDARTSLGWSQSTFVALHAGNMGLKQGLENVVAAAHLADEREDDVEFILLGDGSERQALVDAGENARRLRFIQPLSESEFRLALAAADVLLVNERPGVAAMAVPSKLTSYFDAARPVIAATDPLGITAEEVLAAEAGLVVPAGDPAALLDAVLDVKRDPDAYAARGAAGRSYRERVLDQNAALNRWSILLSRMDKRKRRSPLG